MKKFQILIFGASSTHGNWDEIGGWSHRIRQHTIKQVLSKPNDLEGHVFNLGVPGDTTFDLLKRLESEIKARLFYKETMIIISVGINDSRVNGDNQTLISAEDFENNQKKILDIVRKYTDKIIFVGFTPVDERRTIPWHDGKFSYLNKQIEKFDSIVKSVCKKNHVDFIDLFSSFNSDKNFLKYISDGLHPNTLGHKKIFDSTKPYIDKFLE